MEGQKNIVVELLDLKNINNGLYQHCVKGFDSLTSDRIYRKALPVSEVLEYIMGGGGTHFEPRLVKAFIKHINPYPVNTAMQ